jgi:D-arabinan exo alpha-(1,3)/(1,5)-arabinofuranosidase (non-reducing end)
MDSQFFGGLGMNLGTIPLISKAKTRSISAENFKGEKGKGGMATEGAGAACAEHLGPGWKISPCIVIQPNQLFEMADIEGPGVIQHIWMTTHQLNWRKLILRIYWDDEETPSIETPLGDFFCQGWNEHSLVNSMPISVNPTGALNSYWPMPFRKKARITIENITSEEIGALYYQVTYALQEIPENAAYFHAQFRRSHPVSHKEVHTILEGVKGEGQYVGTYIGWQANSGGWWGEGEIKFFMDGDTDYPTICGTGTEDYFGGAWCWQKDGKYVTYTTPYLGFHQHVESDGMDRHGRRYGMYRWHILDPIRFESGLPLITIQALGWREPRHKKGRYLALQDDICSVAFWYQAEPHQPYKKLPDPLELEIN